MLSFGLDRLESKRFGELEFLQLLLGWPPIGLGVLRQRCTPIREVSQLRSKDKWGGLNKRFDKGSLDTILSLLQEIVGVKHVFFKRLILTVGLKLEVFTVLTELGSQLLDL